MDNQTHQPKGCPNSVTILNCYDNQLSPQALQDAFDKIYNDPSRSDWKICPIMTGEGANSKCLPSSDINQKLQ